MKIKQILVLSIVLLTFSCIKKIDLPKGEDNVGGTDGGGKTTSQPPPPCACNIKAKGTIEACPSKADLWFINASISNQAGPVTQVKSQLLLPVNLPVSFKKNAFPVSFSFSLLPDSVALDCWFCGTPPLPYARKIMVCDVWQDSNQVIAMKPVIYLYPKKETKVKVKLDFKGQLTVTYPDYNEKLKGWEVLAKKDGSLLNLSDRSEHQYLFWEGAPRQPYSFDMREGYCVKGSETKTFLKTVLPKLGLTPKEYNDMIVFWLPRMIHNPYNLIHFAEKDYTQSAPLTIQPAPDNLIRIFMAFQPSKVFVETNVPKIVTPKRSGFTVVEWGGTEMPADNNFSEVPF